MKKYITLVSLFLLGVGARAATPVDFAEVDAASINCFFSPTCTLQVSDTFSPLMLPGATGSGLLQTRVFVGETNSLGEGLYGYEYRIDLTALTATNVPPCLTNGVACFTNRIQVTTNVAICRTNIVDGTNMVVCVTNRVRYFTNEVSCYTNLIPCPETTPCLESLRVPFGPAYTGLNFGTSDVMTAHAYVITSNSLGTIAPVFVQQDGNDILIQFAAPVCPGESSYFIGLVSTRPPRDVRADATLTSGESVTVAARSPAGGRGGAIDCDLSELARAIDDLSLSDLVAPNDNARASRHDALLNLVQAAEDAAEEGELENVVEAVRAIVKKTSGQRNSWVTPAAAERLDPILDELISCLEQASNDGDDGDDCDENGHDNDEDDDGHNGDNGKGKNPGKHHGPPGKHGQGKHKSHRN
jgi:hypothetical protein